MSWVFLIDGFVYKLKKPIRNAYLDFSTVDARRRNCEEELRLNRRLAATVYLETVPLVVTSDGALRLGGEGAIVDWLVRMRRLPAERMLDHVLLRGRLDRRDLRSLAFTLAGFYRDAPRVEIAPAEYGLRFERELCEDREELLAPAFVLPPELVARALKGPAHILARERALVESRATRVIEAHGDLRPEHVCLEEEPVIIDALEFNRGFRLLDPADELAYLSMECERLGPPEMRGALFDAWREASGDDPSERLVDFYASARAALRAKLAIWHLREPGRRGPEHWVAKAADYLRVGAAHGEPLAEVTSPAAW